MTKTVDKAIAAIEAFETKARKSVIGVSIKGTEYTLKFAGDESPSIPEADNVNMGR